MGFVVILLVKEGNVKQLFEATVLLVKVLNQAPPTEKPLADNLEAQTGVKASSKTIQCHLQEKGIKWRRKFKKLYMSEKNRLLRLSFAREHISWSVDEWKRIVWSDHHFICRISLYDITDAPRFVSYSY